jgi:hypothetical protein
MTTISGPTVTGALAVQTPQASTVDLLLSPGNGSLLPEPFPDSLGDGAIARLAILLTEADEQDRRSARDIAQKADAAAATEENERVQAMQEKADADSDQALWSGVGEIAGGLCTAGGAFVGGASASSSTQVAQHGFDWRAVLDGAAKTLPGVGTIGAGGRKAAADQDDANAARLDAQSQIDVRRYSEANDDAQTARDAIQKVEQFLEQIQQTKNAARLSAAGPA